MTSLISRVVEAFAPRAEANPLDDRYYGDYWTSHGGSFGPSLAGVNVSKDNALRVGVFYRAVIIRAQSFAQLPIGVYQRGEKTRTELPDHQLSRAFDRPNPFQTGYEWRRDVQLDLLLWGGAFNQIVYTPDLQFIPLDFHAVKEITKEGDTVRTYEVKRKDGSTVRMVGDRDIWHLKASFGRGLIDLARNTLGLAISAETHSSVFMRRGVKSAVVLQHPGRLKPETAAAMGANFNAAYGGGEGYGKVPVLWEDMKVQTVSIDHQKAQFLELDAATQERLATFAGVAPYMVGLIEKQTSWGTGVEEQARTFNLISQSPDCRYFEQDSARVFLDSGRGTNGKYVRINDAAALRSRNMEQAQIHEINIRSHIKTPNECRRDLDMDPIEGGDEFPAVPGAKNGTEGDAPEKPGEEQPAKPKVIKAESAEAIGDAVAAKLNASFDKLSGSFAALAARPIEIKAERPLAGVGAIPAEEWNKEIRLNHLAAMVASEILTTEARDMAEIAKATAADSGKYTRAIGAYFARRSDAVAQTLSITKADAEAYCEEQRRIAADGGAKVLDTWAKDHAGRVVSLALGTSTTFPVKE